MLQYWLQIYQSAGNRRPFSEWLDELNDRQARTRVQTRIDRLALGNFGDYRALDGGVYELRIDWGPGYRVYFARIGKLILLLLCGGDKTTQQRDIEHAKTYLQDYQNRTEKARSSKRLI
jgi:putative addiction module killer protein